MEYYIDEIQDYLETLAAEHVEVRHGEAGVVGFIRFHSPDDVNSVTTNPGRNLVAVAQFYGRVIGEADTETMRQHVGIRFLSYAEARMDGNQTEAINEAEKTAFAIMMDFLSRFRLDMRDDIGDCGALRGLELENASWEEIPEAPTLVNHYGWELSIPYRSTLPEYNPDRWAASAFTSEFSPEFK